MKKGLYNSLYVEKVTEEKDIPFQLLLLADETVDAIQRYIYSSDVYVAKHCASNHLIGVFVLQTLNECEIEIKNIAVDKRLQGRGIGTFLIDKIKEIALGCGANVLWVGTPDSATPQLNFYQANGFRRAGIRKDYFIENYPEPIIENGTVLRDMVMLQIIWYDSYSLRGEALE